MKNRIEVLNKYGYIGQTKKTFIVFSLASFLLIYAFKPSIFFDDDGYLVMDKINLPLAAIFIGYGISLLFLKEFNKIEKNV